ncbi:imm11 family protein [Corallococcus terminator]
MQREYFVLMRARSQHHPLLAWNQSGSAFRKARPVAVSEPVKLRLGEPVPEKPVMVDFHSLPAPVVSPRLKEVLEAADLRGVQFIPADVEVGDAVHRYWLVHMWRELRCVDREHSVFEDSETGLFMLLLDRLVLDEAVLREIPLEERLAFALEEHVVQLFHRTVVERVLAMTPPPEGLRFVPVAEWGDSSAFR